MYLCMISLPVLAGGVLFFIMKKRRTSLFLNLFGRKNADLEFFDLQLFIMPKKLGFYYKGRLPGYVMFKNKQRRK